MIQRIKNRLRKPNHSPETSQEISVNSVEINTGQWTTEEQNKFVFAIRVYGKDYQSISDYIGTRDVK